MFFSYSTLHEIICVLFSLPASPSTGLEGEQPYLIIFVFPDARPHRRNIFNTVYKLVTPLQKIPPLNALDGTIKSQQTPLIGARLLGALRKEHII